MKNKRLHRGLLIIFLILLVILGYMRYRQVNAHPKQFGVTQERLIKQGELVHAYHVNFKIRQASLIETKDDVKAKITLTIEQTGSANYGMKNNNPMFVENMYLNVPYGISPQSVGVFTKSNRRVSAKYIIQHIRTKQTYNLYFVTLKESYVKRAQKTRFSFLVPTKKHFVKYSLLLE